MLHYLALTSGSTLCGQRDLKSQKEVTSMPLLFLKEKEYHYLQFTRGIRYFGSSFCDNDGSCCMVPNLFSVSFLRKSQVYSSITTSHCTCMLCEQYASMRRDILLLISKTYSAIWRGYISPTWLGCHAKAQATEPERKLHSCCTFCMLLLAGFSCINLGSE